MKLNYPLKEHVVTQGFGERPEVYKQFGMKGHNGIDYRAKYVDCFAAADGTVTISDTGGTGYGRSVKIAHPDGSVTLYGHFSAFSVKTGQKVISGQKIGITGTTGFSSGPHLHFQYKPANPNMNNGFYGAVDPTPYLTGASPSQPDNNSPITSRKFMMDNGVIWEALRDFQMKDSSSDNVKNVPARGGLGSLVPKGWTGRIADHSPDYGWYLVSLGPIPGQTVTQGGWTRVENLKAIPGGVVEKPADLAPVKEKIINFVKGL